MYRLLPRRAAVALLVLLFGTAAQAAPISWTFSGTVTSVEGAGTVFSDLGIAAGDGFSGTVTYERRPAVFATTRQAPAGEVLEGEIAEEIRTGFAPGLVSFSGIEFQTGSGTVAYAPNYIAEGGRLQQSNNEWF